MESSEFNDVLFELGVRDDTLTSDERARLDADGFLRLDGILSSSDAARMLAAIEERFAADGIGLPDGPPEAGNLQNASDAFDVCVTHPRVLAAVAHVLSAPFCSLGVHSRPNPPGRGHQALHVDWGGPPAQPGEYFVCNSIWPLADFTAENGATRVVPGSHRWGQNPHDALADPNLPHPDQIQLVAPLGSVVVFNSHLWHGAMLNRSDAFRPNVTSYWSRLETPVGCAASTLSDPASARLKPAARRLFEPG